LTAAGFAFEARIYENMRVAQMEQVEELEKLCENVDGIFSVGTGSINDICRLAAHRQKKAFAIFATAPSMDGFASDSAPITCHNFKITYPASPPSVIIADTKILAEAPAELKSAGFGDMIGKYIALVDWKIAHLVIGEYYCENVARLTQEALDRIVSLADKVTENNEETAATIMEALVLTGIGMALAKCSRPASGTEHILSHFWEVKKLEQGLLSDYHGKKVGVATILVNGVYREMINHADVSPTAEHSDWDAIIKAYGKNLAEDMIKLNTPTITSEVAPAYLKECWPEICRIVQEGLPSNGKLLQLMKTAGAATTIEEIDVTPELCTLGLQYHPYMRHRISLMRLRPMLQL